MRLEAYVVLLFSFSLVFFLLGINTVGMNMLYNQQTGQFLDIGTILNSVTNSILTGSSNTGPLVAIGLGALASLAAAYFIGFSAMFIIPVVIMIAIMNFLITPMSMFVSSPNDPVWTMVYIPFVVFMNILCVISLTNFIRGGAT